MTDDELIWAMRQAYWKELAIDSTALDAMREVLAVVRAHDSDAVDNLRAGIKIAIFRLIDGDDPRDVGKGLCATLQDYPRTADAAMRAEG